ncbi:MAG: ABC-F family ATP-binding cassette domain-containing protein [Anaeroplasmataceae bacterium]
MSITLDDVYFKYDDKYILKGCSITFNRQNKIGIVGFNGIGKSTLLNLLTNNLNFEKGTITKPSNLKLAYLTQDIKQKDISIKEYMYELNKKSYKLEEYQITSMLNKFKIYDENKLIKNLSGGEAKRVSIARCLLEDSDILVLDEPTNHLDNDMIMSLETILKKTNKGIIMVTHDRYFLENICDKMVELDNAKLYSYDANYSRFLELKQERMLSEQKYEAKIKSILKNEIEWVRRSPQARTTKSKSRVDRFNEMSNIEFNKDKKLEITSNKTRLGKKLIEIYDAKKSINVKLLFSGFNLMLNKSDIIGFVGANGCGKSTLFKIILDKDTLDSGEIIKGETLRIGYFSQDMNSLDDELRVIDYLKNLDNFDYENNSDFKTLLESFMFDSSMQHSKIKNLSIGTKRRLQLLGVLVSNPNVLILDEPTNDLDIYTLEVLEEYLYNFNGPILLVSHDRYFLDKICNKLCVFENGNIIPSNLSFSEYIKNRKETDNTSSFKLKTKVKNNDSSRLKKRLEKIEESINAIEDKVENLKIEEKNHLSNYKKLLEISNQIQDYKKEIESLEFEYLEILEEVQNNEK